MNHLYLRRMNIIVLSIYATNSENSEWGRKTDPILIIKISFGIPDGLIWPIGR